MAHIVAPAPVRNAGRAFLLLCVGLLASAVVTGCFWEVVLAFDNLRKTYHDYRGGLGFESHRWRYAYYAGELLRLILPFAGPVAAYHAGKAAYDRRAGYYRLVLLSATALLLVGAASLLVVVFGLLEVGFGDSYWYSPGRQVS